MNIQFKPNTKLFIMSCLLFANATIDQSSFNAITSKALTIVKTLNSPMSTFDPAFRKFQHIKVANAELKADDINRQSKAAASTTYLSNLATLSEAQNSTIRTLTELQTTSNTSVATADFTLQQHIKSLFQTLNTYNSACDALDPMTDILREPAKYFGTMKSDYISLNLETLENNLFYTKNQIRADLNKLMTDLRTDPVVISILSTRATQALTVTTHIQIETATTASAQPESGVKPLAAIDQQHSTQTPHSHSGSSTTVPTSAQHIGNI